MSATTKRWNALILFIFLVSAALRISYLGTPREVVFDEYYFGRFATAYCCTGKNFYDGHPPHAKILIAWTGKLFGYQGEYDFSRIGAKLDGPGIWGLRILPAILGSLVPVMVYVLLTQMGVSSAGAFLGAFALTFDNAFIVQSRVIGLDYFLVTFTLSALSCLIAYLRAREPKKRFALLLGCGVSCGLAAGAKFSGTAAMALVLIVVLAVAVPWRTRSYLPVLKVTSGIAAFALLVYLAGWVAHFELLPRRGDGDRFYAPTGAVLRDTAAIHQRMLATHYKLEKPHQDASRWWQWPLMQRPIYYWTNKTSHIYFLGNPVVWWGSTFFVLGLFAYLSLRKRSRLYIHEPRTSLKFLWIPVTGYALTFLPYAFIPRVMFLYHYMSALVFGLMAVIVWLDAMSVFQKGGPRYQERFYFGALAGIFLGFLFMLPLTYGFRSFEWHHAALRYLFPVL